MTTGSLAVLALGATAAAASVVVALPSPRRRPGGPDRRRASTSGRPVHRAGRAARAGPPRASVPMVLDLVAAALAGGTAAPRALAVVADCLERAGDPAGAELRAFAFRVRAGQLTVDSRSGRIPGAPTGARPAAVHPAVAALAAALALSVATGAGPAALIRADAEEHRRRAQAAEVRAAQRLGVLVLLPTGLCLLPAFLLLTVVPLVIDMVLG